MATAEGIRNKNGTRLFTSSVLSKHCDNTLRAARFSVLPPKIQSPSPIFYLAKTNKQTNKFFKNYLCLHMSHVDGNKAAMTSLLTFCHRIHDRERPISSEQAIFQSPKIKHWKLPKQSQRSWVITTEPEVEAQKASQVITVICWIISFYLQWIPCCVCVISVSFL